MTMLTSPKPHSTGFTSLDDSIDIRSVSHEEPVTPPMLEDIPPSSSPATSRPSLPPTLRMRQSNPKHLALSLSLPATTSNVAPLGSPFVDCPTPTAETDAGSKHNTPYTPGPPRTPALAMSLGRASATGLQRPSLLSLITQPPSSDDMPPTPVPVHVPRPIRSSRERLRGRSNTAEEVSNHMDIEKGFRSAHPDGKGFPAIDETSSRPMYIYPVIDIHSSASPSTSATASRSSTPSTSRPIMLPYETRPAEPYGDGPIQVLPGVFLGAEESVWHWKAARVSKRIRVFNVAQEVDDPFERSVAHGKGKEKVKLASYPPDSGRPGVEYCHLRWSHGESGLAELPIGVRLDDLFDPAPTRSEREMWGFWDAIRWLEAGRRAGEPILIHCQCGISRSATLVIAYVMSLAASGLLPDLLGHLSGMQDAYEFVKCQSPWIGPNVSLVFQLVEFARNLTSLLLEHAGNVDTSFPKTSDQGVSEAEWAARRAAFEDTDMEYEERGLGSPMSPEEVEDEARRWDEAMIERKQLR